MATALLLEAGKAMAAYVGKEQDSNKLIGNVAKLLNSAVERILKEVAALLKTSLSEAFTKNKLEGAINLAGNISEFWEDYNRNPAGRLSRSRLFAIEEESIKLLATLDDEDVALVGIVHYISVATIRLCALLEQGKAEPLELPGVVEKAKRYREYVQSLLPRVEQRIRSRLTGPVPLRVVSGPSGGIEGKGISDLVEFQYVGYILDGSPISVTYYAIPPRIEIDRPPPSDLSEEFALAEVKTAMEEKAMALIDSIIGPMRDTVATWPV